MKGALHLVGTGFNVAGQVTAESLACISNADVVLSMLGDPASRHWLHGIRPDAQSLVEHYAEGKQRLDTYAEMTERMLALVREEKKVCVAFYGHPGVFVNPSHAAVRQAAKEGLSARMYPGISAESCLFADLGFDPTLRGCQSFEATDLLVRRRKFDTSTSLILWQIGSVGVDTYHNKALWSRKGLEILVDRLLQDYPPDHRVLVYEASPLPICKPRIDPVELKDLAGTRVSIISTLLVPPLDPAAVDWEMRAQLQQILGHRVCRDIPFGEQIRELPQECPDPSPSGQLTMVGLGYGLAGQVTPEAHFHLEHADRIFYLVSDPVSSAWLASRYQDAESLHHLYGEASDSAVFKEEMTEKMLNAVRCGERVCAAFTGHPAIVVPPAIDAVRRAREEGYKARILPSISIEDCLIAELGVDPGVHGRSLYDATDFVLRPRIVDTSSNLVLLQAGTLGEQLYRNSDNANSEVIDLLVKVLLRHYPPDHEAVIYETSQNPFGDTRVVSGPIGELTAMKLNVVSTIFIPPATTAGTDPSRIRELGLS